MFNNVDSKTTYKLHKYNHYIKNGINRGHL